MQDTQQYSDYAEQAPAAGSATDYAPGEGLSGFFSGWMDQLDILFHPDQLLESLSGVPLIGASVIVTVGILCIFNGYRWHRWLVAALAFLCGLGIGFRLSQEMGRSTIVAASVGCLCAIVATPLLRITVAIFGGITGAFIGANTWTALEASPADAQWAGAVIGFVVIAMTSLLMFRLVIVLFTSVGGAGMVVLGSIALLMQVPDWESTVRQSLENNTTIVPLLLLLAAVSGFVIQESRLRGDGVSIMRNEARMAED